MGEKQYSLGCLSVSGSPSAMGEQQGEALRDKIKAFVDVRFAAMDRYTRERGRVSGSKGIMEIGAQSMALFEEWDPEGYAEHEGIARGSNLDAVTLYTATQMTDMRDALLLSGSLAMPTDSPADEEGCSALIIPRERTRNGHAIAGQTWDLNPSDIEYIVAINRRPDKGPQTWSVTCAGCLTLVGINHFGLALGTTNIKTWGARPGVGYLALLHRMIRCKSARSAASILGAAPRSAAHTYWLADPREQLDLETSPERIVERSTIDGPLCHTNHCLDPVHAELQGEETIESSRARFVRMTSALTASDHTVEGVRQLFADRSDGVNSINRYAEDDQGTATNSVFIAVPARREAYACRGPADRGQWLTLKFS